MSEAEWLSRLSGLGPQWTGNINKNNGPDRHVAQFTLLMWEIRNLMLRENKWCARGGTQWSRAKPGPWISVWAPVLFHHREWEIFLKVFTDILYMVNFSFTVHYFKHLCNCNATCKHKTSLSALNTRNYGQAHLSSNLHKTLNAVVPGYKIPFASTDIFRLTSLNFSIQAAFAGYKYLKSSWRISIKKYSPFGTQLCPNILLLKL